MSDFLDNVESLKRVVATPGTFDTLFPDTTDQDLVGTLLDGIAQAQLDGLLASYTYDDTGTVTPDLSAPQSALVILYAGAILIRAQLLNLKTHIHYASGTAVFEQDMSTNVLRDLLKDLQARIANVVAIGSDSGAGAAFYMADQYVMSMISRYDRSSLLTDFVFDPAGFR
jgi:hypothetical protein